MSTPSVATAASPPVVAPVPEAKPGVTSMTHATINTAPPPPAVAIPQMEVPKPAPAVSPPQVASTPTHVAPVSSATTKATSKSKKKKNQVTVTMATAASAQANGQGAQGENTGRWTAEEHRLFLQGLEQHGKGWKKIASLIKSRTVVQIRTHAQKYFQKLAKARQNGEEGDVAMEGRGGTAAVPSVTASAGQSSKRRRPQSGTKRKAIQSVVSSAQRQGKKLLMMNADGTPSLPAVSPALLPHILPPRPESGGTLPCVPAITTARGTISGNALEESLFRFLTPAPIARADSQVSEVARQAGANPITLPLESGGAPSGGEVSPTGVADLAMYPSWTDTKDTPSWYAKGSDVDALLDVADSLDWFADSGELHETYEATHQVDDAPAIPDIDEKPIHGLAHTPSVNNMSLNTLPRVDSAVDVVVPPLPSLFDGAADAVEPNKKLNPLIESVSTATMDEHLQVFDSPLEEHDFVSTILENTGESSGSLPVLN